MDGRTDLGERSDVAAVLALTPVAGLALVDVGCGAGHNARELAEAGASVLAVEPDPIQAAKNRDAAPAPGVTFVEARAERLPAETGSVDGVLFFRSLHHVPVEAMAAALAEAARALKPGTGFLCVIEPGVYRPPLPCHPPVPRRDAGARGGAGRARSIRRGAVSRTSLVLATSSIPATRISTRSPPASLADLQRHRPRAGGNRRGPRAVRGRARPTRATTPSSSRCCSTCFGRRSRLEPAAAIFELGFKLSMGFRRLFRFRRNSQGGCRLQCRHREERSDVAIQESRTPTPAACGVRPATGGRLLDRRVALRAPRDDDA